MQCVHTDSLTYITDMRCKRRLKSIKLPAAEVTGLTKEEKTVNEVLQLPLPPPQSQCNWLCLKHLLGFNKTEDCHSCLNWMETHPALWSVHYSTVQGHYIHFPIFLLRKNTTVKLQWGTWEAVNVFFSLVVTGNWNSTAVNAQHCESTLRFLLMGWKD